MSSKLLKFINHKLQPKELSCHSYLHPTLKATFCQTNYLLRAKPLPPSQQQMHPPSTTILKLHFIPPHIPRIPPRTFLGVRQNATH